MTAPAPSRVQLAATLSGTLAAIAGTLIFIWFGDYFPAAIGALFSLIGAWLAYEELKTDTAADHERDVIRILTGLGGRATEAEFEAALEAETDRFGYLSGEVLEELRDASERLQAAGRLRIDGGLVALMPAAGG
jgi:hypothetical protein